MTPLHYSFLALAVLSLFPIVPSAAALTAGIVFVLVFGNPFPAETKKWTPVLLQFSVIGMGAAMDLRVVGRVGVQGLSYTMIGILMTLLLGFLLGRLFKIGRDTTLLVSSGTAICGGSAIAAVAAVIPAKSSEISVSLAVVFMLNAVALVVFPPMGHALSMSQHDFGLWSALAIHDTSSVVGAGMQYGADALEVATTVKLARALWIIPLAFGIGMLRSRGVTFSKTKKPCFILGFLMMSALVTWIPELQTAGLTLSHLARRCLVLTLFLIGSGLTRQALREVSLRPFLLGFVLWLCVAASTLAAIHVGWIS